MRKCIRCNAEMVEGLDVKTTVNADKLRVVRPNTSGVMPKNFLGDVRAAVCPMCGSMEFYLDDLERIREYQQK